MKPPESVTRYEARGDCVLCDQPALVIAEGRIEFGKDAATITARVVEIRHLTPAGSNNCGGLL